MCAEYIFAGGEEELIGILVEEIARSGFGSIAMAHAGICRRA
jgi:hypothetical protein